MNKIIFWIIAGLLALGILIFFTVGSEIDQYRPSVSEDVNVVQSWELPKELREVSGIASVDTNRIACIQDEDGIIFIYDLEKSRIEKKIDFAGPGDYEAISVVGSTAFVMESNGTIFRVENFMGKPKVQEIPTRFTKGNDVEGMGYDGEENRLLIALKGKDPVENNGRGIYAFDLETMELRKDPAYRIDLQNKIFKGVRRKNLQNTFRPSEVLRDFQTGNILLLDGRSPMLLILDNGGNPIDLFILDPQVFPKPEGLAIDRSGNMYISTEGNPGRIHKVNFKSK